MQDWEIAEQQAAGWMRYLGHPDANVTTRGPDHGIDVVSRSAVGQVKAWSKPVGRGDLQKLIGAAYQSNGVALYFFSYAGYSTKAVTLANEIGMRLFTLGVANGNLQPHSLAAARDIKQAAAWRSQATGYVAPARAGAPVRAAANQLTTRIAFDSGTESTWGRSSFARFAGEVKLSYNRMTTTKRQSDVARVVNVVVFILLLEALLFVILACLFAAAGEKAWRAYQRRS